MKKNRLVQYVKHLVQMQAETALLSRQTGAIVGDALDWAANQQRRSLLTVAISTAVAPTWNGKVMALPSP